MPFLLLRHDRMHVMAGFVGEPPVIQTYKVLSCGGTHNSLGTDPVSMLLYMASDLSSDSRPNADGIGPKQQNQRHHTELCEAAKSSSFTNQIVLGDVDIRQRCSQCSGN